MRPALSVLELRARARARVPLTFFEYAGGGSLEEGTLRGNAEASKRLMLEQRILINVGKKGADGLTTVARRIRDQFDARASWRDRDWIRAAWHDKLILKGVMSVEVLLDGGLMSGQAVALDTGREARVTQVIEILQGARHQHNAHRPARHPCISPASTERDVIQFGIERVTS